MRRRFAPVLLLVAALAGGCFGAPDPPSLADDPLVEVYRMPAPVPAPPAGRHEWAFLDERAGLVAQGRRLASVDFTAGRLRWAVDLPEAYAVRDATDVLGGDGSLVLVGASSLRAVSVHDGRTRWERPYAGRVIRAGQGSDAVLVAARCTGHRCVLTGVALETGASLWTTTVTRPVTLSPGTGDCGCVHAAGGGAVTEVLAASGRTRWTLPTPGPDPVLKPGLYRLTVITPPVSPDCVTTVRGVDDGRQVWRREYAWHDAGALAKPCRFDRERLFGRYGLLVPLRERVAILDDHHGTARPAALRPGEFLVGDDLTWSPAGGYRAGLDRPADLDVPAPADGRPWGRDGLLASGRGVVLHDRLRGVRWRSETASAVCTPAPDRLVHQEGDTLVALGPQPRRER